MQGLFFKVTQNVGTKNIFNFKIIGTHYLSHQRSVRELTTRTNFDNEDKM